MDLIYGLKQYVIALEIVGILGGCATTSNVNNSTKKPDVSIGTVMKILNVADPNLIENILDYKTLVVPNDGILRTIAGIYAGTVNVENTPTGCSVDGFYSQYEHPEAMERTLIKADVNNDGVITEQEAINLAVEVCETYQFQRELKNPPVSGRR